MEAGIGQWLGAGGLAALFTLLVKVLWKTDTKWLAIIDSQDEDIHELRARVEHLEEKEQEKNKEIRALHRENDACVRKNDDLEYQVSKLTRQLADAHVIPPAERTERTRRSDSG
jgi:cell division protein FtsB